MSFRHQRPVFNSGIFNDDDTFSPSLFGTEHPLDDDLPLFGTPPPLSDDDDVDVTPTPKFRTSSHEGNISRTRCLDDTSPFITSEDDIAIADERCKGKFPNTIAYIHRPRYDKPRVCCKIPNKEIDNVRRYRRILRTSPYRRVNVRKDDDCLYHAVATAERNSQTIVDGKMLRNMLYAHVESNQQAYADRYGITYMEKILRRIRTGGRGKSEEIEILSDMLDRCIVVSKNQHTFVFLPRKGQTLYTRETSQACFRPIRLVNEDLHFSAIVIV